MQKKRDSGGLALYHRWQMRSLRSLNIAILLIVSISLSVNAQNDWHTYPERNIAELAKQHTRDTLPKPDMIISADPFPSKTIAVYMGKHRPVSALTTDFIKIWAESRNLLPQTHTKITEEYLFKENDKEYWVPAISKIAPFVDKELKEGDTVMIYYFFMGGYNPKTLQDKRTGGEKVAGLPDRIEFMFVLEEFQKPKPPEPPTIDQPLAAAIDLAFKIPAGADWAPDTRYVKSRSVLEWTGQIRETGKKRMLPITEWSKTVGLTEDCRKTFVREALFREGDKEYWIPVLRSLLIDMEQKLVKGDKLNVSTMLVGGIGHPDRIEWVFWAGVISKAEAK